MVLAVRARFCFRGRPSCGWSHVLTANGQCVAVRVPEVIRVELTKEHLVLERPAHDDTREFVVLSRLVIVTDDAGPEGDELGRGLLCVHNFLDCFLYDLFPIEGGRRYIGGSFWVHDSSLCIGEIECVLPRDARYHFPGLPTSAHSRFG